MIWKDENNFLETIKDQKRFGVFLDMGVGKTSLLLALADQKFFDGVKKILIITPKKVSLSTWQNEIKKWKN
jgi:GTPase SAR1 family protein